MNKVEAIEKIKYSLQSEEARVITPEGEVYEEYVENLAKTLIDSVIEPIRVKITSSCAKEGELNLYKNSVVWAIARNKDNWLLTLENEMEFALGFGNNSDNILMHGFSSADVLGEWCA